MFISCFLLCFNLTRYTFIRYPCLIVVIRGAVLRDDVRPRRGQHRGNGFRDSDRLEGETAERGNLANRGYRLFNRIRC